MSKDHKINRVLCFKESSQFHEVPCINCKSYFVGCWCAVQEVVSCANEFKDLPYFLL